MERDIVWTDPAVKDLRRLDRATAQRVVQAVERLATTGHGDVKVLTNWDRQWRLRVGDCRVRFTVDGSTSTLYILRVLPRENAYRRS